VSPHDSTARERERLELLRRWSALLDNAFSIPGTRIRFGLDPLLGLFPGLGDFITPAFSALLLIHASRVGVPRVVQFRMLVNALLDTVIGIVPVVGDLFDVAWKSNVRNVALIERHARGDVRPTTADWVFLWLVLAAVAVVALIPIVTLVLLFEYLRR
jgi:hypothetical protein